MLAGHCLSPLVILLSFCTATQPAAMQKAVPCGALHSAANEAVHCQRHRTPAAPYYCAPGTVNVLHLKHILRRLPPHSHHRAAAAAPSPPAASRRPFLNWRARQFKSRIHPYTATRYGAVASVHFCLPCTKSEISSLE